MQILDHNLKAYKALIKSFKKANRAYQLIFLLFCFIVLLFWVECGEGEMRKSGEVEEKKMSGEE